MNRFIALVLTCLACSPHIMSDPNDDQSVADAGTTTDPPPQMGLPGTGGSTTLPSTPPAPFANLTIMGPGSGSVTLGSTEYRLDLSPSSTWKHLPTQDSYFAAMSDPGSYFVGWFGACDAAIFAKDPSRCKPLATDSSDPTIIAVFGTTCSSDGWCKSRLPLPLNASIFKVITTSTGDIKFLGSDGYVYTTTSTLSMLRAQQIFATDSGVTLPDMCNTSTNTLYLASSTGVVARLSGTVAMDFVGTANLAWLSASCGSDGGACVAGDKGRLYCTSGGTSGWARLDLSSLSLPTAPSFAAVYSAKNGHALAVGRGGIVVNYLNDAPNNLTPTGTTNDWYGTDGTSEKNVWIVGSNAKVLYYDGTTLSPITVPPPATVSTNTEYLMAVRAVPTAPSSEMYAVGGKGLVVHCTGTTCTREKTDSDLWLRTVTTIGSPPHTVLACGESGTCLVKKLR